MLRRSLPALLVLAAHVLLPQRCPAPFIYRLGEGWVYEPVGTETGAWQRTRAKDQLEVAQAEFDRKAYSSALRAARRVVNVWPLSDYAPPAQYLIGRCYEAQGSDQKAFEHYQRLLEKFPKAVNYEEVLKRQYEIAGRFLAGQWFKVWGYIPFFPSMEKTAEMYEKIIRNGPFSEVGPLAQLKVGEAREKQKEFPQAVKAYEAAADKYRDREQIAADALFKAGMVYTKESKASDYDQGIPTSAITTLTDFIGLYPNDPRVREAQQSIDTLKVEQARGSYQIAKFYEKKRRYQGALIYYNEVVLKDPNSPYAAEAKQRIEELKARLPQAAAQPALPPRAPQAPPPAPRPVPPGPGTN
jgi:outer membrane protein assembly factor BamD